MGWVARYTSPEAGVSLQIVTHDAAAPADPVVSVKVDDVDAAYEEAQRRGYEIAHPLPTSSLGSAPLSPPADPTVMKRRMPRPRCPQRAWGRWAPSRTLPW